MHRVDFNRRTMLRLAAGAAASGITGTAVTGRTAKAAIGADRSAERLQKSLDLRTQIAQENHDFGAPAQLTNGDEARYLSGLANYTKGLPHNARGEVDTGAYNSMLKALGSGEPQDFDGIVLGGSAKLVNPQSGLTFDVEGLDSHQFAIDPAPALSSAQRAGEAVEDYWMALLRDVRFAEYADDPLARAAAAELSRLSDFRGPTADGSVTAQTLFRGLTAGDVVGPYVSQFLLKPFDYGSIPIDHKIKTYQPATDYLTTAQSWLAAQNGRGPFGSNVVDPTRRYIRNGRDLAAYVHVDVLYQASMDACIWLLGNGAPVSAANPYRKSGTQAPFTTFGGPYVSVLIAEAASRALKASWFQKWFVHRAIRPEEYGGRIHFMKTGGAEYPLHSDVVNSEALARVAERTGSYLLPQAFPEGCPQHPSYTAGHATVVAACVTVMKAFFDENAPLAGLTDIVEASPDGLSLTSYTGADRGLMTVGSELNKLAGNISIARNIGGVHWRSDYVAGMQLGEAVAIGILRDQKATFTESNPRFTFTRFDGTPVTI